MKAEPLNIRDKTFLVNRLIGQAPKSTMIREFFKNADENARLAPEGQRLIEVYPVEIDGTPKLAFWNTGVGMSGTELKSATDLSSSIGKEMALDQNFGIGAKVSGLSLSPEGIRYRSCKDGEVNQVTIGYDEDVETYVRFPVEMSDGTYATIIDVTEVVKAEGRDTSFDWTEVVLFGESEDHNTVAEPLGKGKNCERSYVTSSIFRRFASFSEGVQVKIDVSMTKGGGKGQTGTFRSLKPLETVLDKLPNHERVHVDEGVHVHYIHDPKDQKTGHSLSAKANPATSSTTFCAIVYKGERYDIKSKQKWSAIAPDFGISFGSKVLTVEIEIDDHLALPNQYRSGLTCPDDKSDIHVEEWAEHVRVFMPEWVKEVIRSQSPKSDENFDDLQTDLQKLLDEFRIETKTLSPAKSSSTLTNLSDEGDDSSEPTDIKLDADELMNQIKHGGVGHDAKSQRAKKRKVLKAPQGAKPSKSTIALERVPEIKILDNPQDVSEKGMKGRAGKYYKESQTLFINGLYPVVNRTALELEAELRTLGEAEIVRGAILESARRFMAFRVGKATCYAISKRLSDDWTEDDLDSATTPESLSMAADNYRESIPQTKKWAKDLIAKRHLAAEKAA